MYIEIDRNDKRPIWLQIVDQVIDYITKGQLAPGDPLVPTRQLAQELSISRSSVQIAYEELQSRGYVETSRRGGTKVCPLIPETALALEELSVPAIPPNPFLENKTDKVEHWPDVDQDEKAEIDFRLHEPYVDPSFQTSWRRASNAAMRKENLLTWGYSSPYGLYSVREQISRYLAIERGIYVQARTNSTHIRSETNDGYHCTGIATGGRYSLCRRSGISGCLVCDAVSQYEC